MIGVVRSESATQLPASQAHEEQRSGDVGPEGDEVDRAQRLGHYNVG
jgi:hypothetical protein